MSDERVQVEFGAKTDNLIAGTDAAAKAVKGSVEEMHQSFSLIHGEVEGLEHKFEHLGVSASFALSNLADGSERGVTRVGHALASLGFAFGGVAGGLTTAIAIAGERMIETMHDVSAEADKARLAVEQAAESMRRAGNGTGLLSEARLAQGDVDEAKEKQRSAAAAYDEAKQKLEVLHQEVGRGSPLYRQAKNEEIERYNALKEANRAVDEATAKLKTYGNALLNVRSVGADKSILPEVANVSRPKTPQEIEKEWDEAFKGIQSGINAMGKQLDSQAAENAQRFITDAVRAANEDVQAHERANQQKEKDRASFWQFITQLDEMHAQQEKERIRTSERQWDSTFHNIENMWGQTVQRIAAGIDSVQNLWRDLWHVMVQEAVLGLVRMEEARAAHWLAVNHITAQGVAKDVAVEAMGAIKTIAMDAWKAGAAAWAAMSEVPVVGPFLAPAVAAGTIASVIALAGNIHSAAGGYDVPSGLNPMTQLHAQEMVLPAELANRIRGMTGSGGSSGGDVHLHVHTMDVKGVKQFLHENRDHVADAVRRAVKDGRIKT